MATFLILAVVGLFTAAADAQTIQAASAQLHNTDGVEVGKITLRQAKDNGIWINASFDRLPRGVHAFHIHETGKCEWDFETAGDHFAPQSNKHGVLTPGGPHAGDLPNLHVPNTGRLNVELFVPNLSLEKGATNTVFDADGSAFVVHERVDDYKSQPSGNAGARIACGLIADKIIDTTSR